MMLSDTEYADILNNRYRISGCGRKLNDTTLWPILS